MTKPLKSPVIRAIFSSGRPKLHRVWNRTSILYIPVLKYSMEKPKLKIYGDMTSKRHHETEIEWENGSTEMHGNPK